MPPFLGGGEMIEVHLTALTPWRLSFSYVGHRSSHLRKLQQEISYVKQVGWQGCYGSEVCIPSCSMCTWTTAHMRHPRRGSSLARQPLLRPSAWEPLWTTCKTWACRMCTTLSMT